MRPLTIQPIQEQACAIKALCQTCRFVNNDYKTGLLTKYQEGMKVLKDHDLLTGAVAQLSPMASPRVINYRCLAKLAIRPKAPTAPILKAASEEDKPAERFAIGLFKPGTHDVIDIDECPIHALPIRRFVKDMREVLEMSPLNPYDEIRKTGDLRYVTIRNSHQTSDLLVVFVTTRPIKRELLRLLGHMRQRGHKVVASFMNVNETDGNAIIAGEIQHIAGAKHLQEGVCELSYSVSATSFFQINPWLAENLYRRLEGLMGPTSNHAVAWDFYCGVGQISLILARAGYRVVGIEENPAAIDDAKKNAARNELSEKTHFITGRVEDVYNAMPSWAEAPKNIILNPSRRGVAENVRKLLMANITPNNPATIFYVSCSIESLARDLKHMVSLGARLRQIEAFDMFPQTDEMEWLAVLTR